MGAQSNFEDFTLGHDNFSEMRKAMVVSQLRTSDVGDLRVIAAMNEVPREDFVPAASRAVAYSDRGVQLGEGRWINTPLSTGMLLDAAELTAYDHVLLVGAATGYTAAVLSKLVKSVVAVEQSAKLATKATKNLEQNANVRMEKATLTEGYAKEAPYDAIIIDGIVEEVPAALVEQLDPDGRLVAAIVEGGVARLALGRKAGNYIGYQYFADCGGAVLPGFEKARSFSF